jgi:hypothetical protein
MANGYKGLQYLETAVFAKKLDAGSDPEKIISDPTSPKRSL